MNPKEAYQAEFDTIFNEKMDEVMDVLADDIWFAMGSENEALFKQAAIEDDQGELGRIMSVAIANSTHRLVKWDRVAELSGQTDAGRREARDRDLQQRREDLLKEAS